MPTIHPQPDSQLELFAGPSVPERQPARLVNGATLGLARRLVRAVEARGPQLVTDLSVSLGADLGDTYLAAGIAQQWRRVDVCDGFVVPAPQEAAS
jgi:hypothetical protein